MFKRDNNFFNILLKIIYYYYFKNKKMTILATNYLKHLSLLCTYNYVFILNNQNISIFYICMCVYCNLIGLVEKK